MPTYVGLLCALAFLVLAFLCVLVGMAYQAPAVPLEPEPEPPEGVESEASRLMSAGTNRDLLLFYVGRRAEYRRAAAEQEWDRLCRVVVGHERCDCRDCDLMFEVAFGTSSAAAVSHEIRGRLIEGEGA